MSRPTSPFKFLDAYGQGDRDIFFGREKETDDLYHALSGVKHLLVYGPSGAGKTSLIECGLRNQFSDADWFALTIRRGADMTGAVFAAINQALSDKLPLDPATKRPLDAGTDFGQAIENLFGERYQPVYLLFDQFEELLISGSEEEKKDFFARLNQLIRYKVPCRVLLIMREEFIGHLSEFEPLCPSLFHHRFRVEKMRRETVKEVISETLNARHFKASFRVEDSGQLTDRILSKLPDMSREIELAHVQVFLSELWERAAETGDLLPTLHEGLVRTDDNLTGVLDSFLKKQLAELDKAYGENAPLEVLATMISERHTKLQISIEALQKELNDKAISFKAPLAQLLQDLEKRRILRTIRSGEQIQYEISHDVLALVVGRNLTEEMQLREKAREVYRVYEGWQRLLSREELDDLRPFENYLTPPDSLSKRITESKAEIARKQQAELEKAQQQAEQERELREQAEQAKNEAEKQRIMAEQNEAVARDNEKRARQRTRLALFVSMIALGLAGFAWYFWRDANVQTEEAKRLLAEIIKKDSLNRIASYNRFMAEAQNLENLRRYDEAIGQYEAAKAFARDTIPVVEAIFNCRAARDNQLAFTAQMKEAEEHINSGNYPSAIEAYRQALALEVNPPEVKARLSDLKNLLQEALRKDKSAADALRYDLEKAKPYRGKVQQTEQLLRQIQVLINESR